LIIKKSFAFFICILLIFVSIPIYKQNNSVEANVPVQQNKILDNDYVLNRTRLFANVIYHSDWSGPENFIPKGRSWATAGENYTENLILNDIDICGLNNATKLQLGYVSGLNGFERDKNGDLLPATKKYTTKVIIRDYKLTIHDGSNVWDVPMSELYPFGIGLSPFGLLINQRCYFNGQYTPPIKIMDFDATTLSPFSGATNGSYYNVSASVLNSNFPGNLSGTVRYIENNQTMPINQTDQAFIINEEQFNEKQINNLSDNSTGCILINQGRGYHYQNTAYQNCSFARSEGVSNNLSKVINGVKSGFEYFVIKDGANNLNFFNISQTTFDAGSYAWAGLLDLNLESSGIINLIVSITYVGIC